MIKERQIPGFIGEVSSIPGSEGIRLCIQCGTCTASCPSAERMDHTPAELISMTRAGMRDEVLSSNAMWYCLSCYLCTVRCPRGIKPADFMHALDCLAVREGYRTRTTRTPVMYRVFSEFVYKTGKLPEFGFMAKFYILTNPFKALKMIPVMIDLVGHNRLKLMAKGMPSAARKQMQAILDKAKMLEKTS